MVAVVVGENVFKLALWAYISTWTCHTTKVDCSVCRPFLSPLCGTHTSTRTHRTNMNTFFFNVNNNHHGRGSKLCLPTTFVLFCVFFLAHISTERAAPVSLLLLGGFEICYWRKYVCLLHLVGAHFCLRICRTNKVDDFFFFCKNPGFLVWVLKAVIGTFHLRQVHVLTSLSADFFFFK